MTETVGRCPMFELHFYRFCLLTSWMLSAECIPLEYEVTGSFNVFFLRVCAVMMMTWEDIYMIYRKYAAFSYLCTIQWWWLLYVPTQQGSHICSTYVSTITVLLMFQLDEEDCPKKMMNITFCATYVSAYEPHRKRCNISRTHVWFWLCRLVAYVYSITRIKWKKILMSAISSEKLQ